jgi:putative endonuclease
VLVYYAYVLVSETTGRRYIGRTDDVHRRLTGHNSVDHNPRKHTSRNAGPWRLVHQEEFAARSEAMRRKRWLKNGMGRAWLDATLGRASPPAAD